MSVKCFGNSEIGWIYDMTIAENLVKAYYAKILGYGRSTSSNLGIYIVWQCYILGNRKYLISTTEEDGRYFEVTYNEAKDEWYVDEYVKNANVKMEVFDGDLGFEVRFDDGVQ